MLGLPFVLAALTWDVFCLVVVWTTMIEVLGSAGILPAIGVTIMAVTKAILWPARRLVVRVTRLD